MVTRVVLASLAATGLVLAGATGALADDPASPNAPCPMMGGGGMNMGPGMMGGGMGMGPGMMGGMGMGGMMDGPGMGPGMMGIWGRCICSTSAMSSAARSRRYKMTTARRTGM